MNSKLRKKIVAAGLSAMMLVGIIPTTVFASEDPVSIEKLEIMVNEAVEKIDFNNLGIDKIIKEINESVTTTVTGAVNSMLTTENIKLILKPTIKGLVEVALKDVAVPEGVDINKIIDKVLENECINLIVDKVLTNELTQEILDRTVQYAVEDIMDIVGVPTVGEVTEASKEDLLANAIDDIWNARKTEYFEFKVFGKVVYSTYYDMNLFWQFNPLKDVKYDSKSKTIIISPKGWNNTAIAAKLQLDLLKIVDENIQAPDLSTINYEEIVANAAKKAIRDVINEKIEEVKTTINTVIENKVAEIKVEAEKAINDAVLKALESIKKKFPWKPWRPY